MDLSWLFTPPRDYTRVRGPEAVDPEAAADRTRAFREPYTTVAGVTVPDPFFERGVTLQGAQGSGKTVTILWLLLPVLRRMAVPGNRQKLIVVDPKGDLAAGVLSLRKAVCPAAPLHLLNPFDRFGSALDPAEFADEPTAITRLVRALTYRNRDARTDEFFDNTARSHLVTLIKILQTRVPGRWGWRDLYHVATHYDLHRRVLKNSRHGRAKAAAIVRKTFAGVVNTVESWLGEYESAFACWDRSPPFSLDAFLRGSGVLVLTVPEDQADSLSPVARAVLRAAKDRLLADTGRDPESRTTVVLDELADLEECVKVVAPLFGRGRSARVSTVCAWQSFPAAADAHGELRMKGLIDNAAVRVWLGCGADSAEVASRYCMAAEVERRQRSFTHGKEPSASESYRTEQRVAVLPSEVQGLPPPHPGDPTVRAYVTANHLPAPVYCEQTLGEFFAYLDALPKVPAYRPRPAADRWLRPWDDQADGLRLEPLFEPEE